MIKPVLSVEESYSNVESRIDLDSNANMVVIRNGTMLREARWYAEVVPFTPNYKSLHCVSMLDACVEYHNAYSGETFLFAFHNTLYIPTMDDNLLPPFIFSKARIEINTILKHHACNRSPVVSNHLMHFKEVDLWVHLLLHGMFSYFSARKPSNDTLNNETIKAIAMTP